MPKYPSDPKPWVDTIYGDKRAWNEAKAQCRDTLLGWAAEARYGSYSELIRHVTAIEWPDGAHTHGGRQVGMLLGQVSLEELDEIEDRPRLSSLVVGQDDDMPSGGYWNLLEELGIEVPKAADDRAVLWAQELGHVFDHFGSMQTRS